MVRHIRDQNGVKEYSLAVSQTAEYALRAVVWLAQNPGHPQTTAQITKATQVPASYLPKVLQPLVRASIISGQRGLHGGYSLKRDPKTLSALEVFNCVDPIERITSCPLKIQGHGVNLCPMHRLMDEAIGGLENRFAKTMIASLVGVPGQSKPLCEMTEDQVIANDADGNGHGTGNGNGSPSGNGSGNGAGTAANLSVDGKSRKNSD